MRFFRKIGALICTMLLIWTTGVCEASQPAAEEARNWNLLLVNGENPLPIDFTVDLIKIQGVYMADVRISNAAKAMFEGARNDGITLKLCSAYRSVGSQRRVLMRKIASNMALGMTDESAREQACSYIISPGCSEHHTGLALDIVGEHYQTLDSGFGETSAGIWLSQHAWEYGFIQRYPENKSGVTGIAYEPWHYRYVGTEAAEVIQTQGLCLEEYLGELPEG